MKFTTTAFALSATLGTMSSYAAAIPTTPIETALTLDSLSVDVSTGSLKLENVRMLVNVVEEGLTYYCINEERKLPQFPDTLDCGLANGVSTFGALRFSVHAPVPQISEFTPKDNLGQKGYTPDWSYPVILHVEWDSGESRTLGTYRVMEGEFKVVSTDSGLATLDAGITSERPPQLDVITQPN